MSVPLTERIYEAALAPEHWRATLEAIGAAAGTPAGKLFVFDGVQPVGFEATDMVAEVTRAFCETGLWRSSERLPYFHRQPVTGFVLARRYFPPALLARDGMALALRGKGLDDQAGTIIALPGGELAVLAFEKPDHGRFAPAELNRLNRLHPHIARAALLSARLGLERARGRVSALEALRLPACVLSMTGRVLAGNALFEAMDETFRPAAFGGLALADKPADRLLQEVLAACRTGEEPVVRSIPVAARGGEPAMVVHVVPLHRAAHDIFSRGDMLLAASRVSASAMVPAPGLLNGLFDLTPAEARLATALAAGQTLAQAGAGQGLRPSTARTYLDRILRKTGTHQQSQLVALLKSAQPFSGGL